MAAEGQAIDALVGALARRQGGYVTRPQLLGLGLGGGAIKYRARRRTLIRVYQGVYAVGHLPTLPVARAKGAVLACGPEAALSHGSAASLWGLFKEWTFPFEVVVTSCRQIKGIRVHRSSTLASNDIRTHLGVRTTSAARTVFDIAPRLEPRRLSRIVNDARLASLLRLSELAELVGRLPGTASAARLRPLVDRPAAPTRSELEDRFLAFCERHGLPRPLLNVTAAGYEVDALFAAEKLIVELDGYSTHSDRDTFERDRERDANTLLAGFDTVRVTDRRMTGAPDAEADRLHALLAQRQRGE